MYTETINTGQLNPEHVRDTISQTMRQILAIAQENCNYFESDEAMTAFVYTATLATTLKPYVRSSNIDACTLTKEGINGSDYNPDIVLDYAGHHLVRLMLNCGLMFPSNKISIYAEDMNGWIHQRSESLEKSERFIVIDPIDESSAIKKKLPYASTGIVIFDNNGLIKAGAVAGLSQGDDRFYLFFRDHNQNLTPLIGHLINQLNLKPYKIPKMDKVPNHEQLKIATLPRRAVDLSNTNLFKNRNFPSGGDIPTFGGVGLLNLLEGKIDAMIDPTKGQPGHEAAWALGAIAAGLSVVKPDGMELTELEITDIVKTDIESRTQMIIGRNKEITEMIVENI